MDSDPTKKWYPWLASEMKKFGIDLVAPTLPNSTDPTLQEWLTELEKTKPDEDTILVGHSRGGVTILKWLEVLAAGMHVRKVILVAANSGDFKNKDLRKNGKSFYSENGYAFEKIRSHCNDFVVMHSRDDQWVPFEAGEENASGLHAKLLTFDDRGHFGTGTAEIPEVLEEIITFDKRKALLVPVNSSRRVLIQDRRGHNVPEWGYFGGSIERGETPLAAVIRESKEELALDIAPNELQYLGTSTTIWNELKIIRFMYLYRTEQKEFSVLEGAGAHWFTYDEARSRLDKLDSLDEIVSRIEKL